MTRSSKTDAGTFTETVGLRKARAGTPVYVAVERREPSVFVCGAMGPGKFSAAQLDQWGKQVGAQIRLVRWRALFDGAE